jgi:hypothetical protein
MSFNQYDIAEFVLDGKTVEKYCKENWCAFENGKCERNDRVVRHLIETMPGHSCNELTPKAIVLNELYGTQVKYIYAALVKICKIEGMRSRVDSGDIGLVNEIAACCSQNNLSFASKYCCMHNNAAYPIYDSIVRAMLRALKKRDKFTKKGITKISDYGEYKCIYDEMIAFYGLQKFTYRQIDKCLWTKGKEITIAKS